MWGASCIKTRSTTSHTACRPATVPLLCCYQHDRRRCDKPDDARATATGIARRAAATTTTTTLTMLT